MNEPTKEKIKNPDSSLYILCSESRLREIIYPKVFEPLNTDAKNLLVSIKKYQDSFLQGESLGMNAIAGISQQTSLVFDPQKVQQAKLDLWHHIQKVNRNLNGQEFSRENFYQALIYFVPQYFAQFGILATSDFLAYNEDGQDQFTFAELRATLMQIEKIEEDATEEWGTALKRRIIYLKNPAMVNDEPVGDDRSEPAGRVIFGNIFLYEKKIRSAFESWYQSLKNIEKQIIEHGPHAMDILASLLEQETENKWSKAVQLAQAKIVQNKKGEFDYIGYKGNIIAHETCHIIDQKKFNVDKILPPKITSSNSEFTSNDEKRRIHDEINPIISSLRHGSDPASQLIELLGFTRPEAFAEIGPIYSRASKWIVDQIISLILTNPNLYGIKINKDSSVGPELQALSQFDILLDNPQLLNELCSKVRNIHMHNLTANLNGSKVTRENTPLKLEPPLPFIDWKPVAIIIGAGALGLEALRRRKNKIKAESALAKINKKKGKKKK